MVLKNGDRLAIIRKNCPEILEALFACFKASIAAVPISARLHPNELAYILEDSGSKAMVYSDVKIFDEGYNELAPGKMGEIVVRGDIVMEGYWEKPEETAETLRDDGFIQEISG